MALGALVVLMACTAPASAAVSVSRPSLSPKPALAQAFTVSGITTPTAKSGVATVVKIQVLSPNASGGYSVGQTLKAKLVKRSGAPGYRYSRALTIRVVGKRAFRALRYADGRLVARSAIRYAEVTYGGGQLAHWTFDEGQGSVAADAIGDADGALEGPPTWTTGKVRGALSFDGDDGVRCTTAEALKSQAVTYAVWVYPTVYDGPYQEIMGFMRDNGGYRASILLYLDEQGVPVIQFQNGSILTVDFNGPAPVATGRWTFLAVSYDGARVRLFVNGALKARVDYAGGIDYGTGLGQLHLGGDLYYAPGGNAFHGLIDEPAVLGRAIR
jgi:hypothetical protein